MVNTISLRIIKLKIPMRTLQYLIYTFCITISASVLANTISEDVAEIRDIGSHIKKAMQKTSAAKEAIIGKKEGLDNHFININASIGQLQSDSIEFTELSLRYARSESDALNILQNNIDISPIYNSLLNVLTECRSTINALNSIILKEKSKDKTVTVKESSPFTTYSHAISNSAFLQTKETALGGESILDNGIYALAGVIAKRFRQEGYTYILDNLKTFMNELDAKTKNTLSVYALPATYRFISTIQSYDYTSLFQLFREAIYADFKAMPSNIKGYALTKINSMPELRYPLVGVETIELLLQKRHHE